MKIVWRKAKSPPQNPSISRHDAYCNGKPLGLSITRIPDCHRTWWLDIIMPDEPIPDDGMSLQLTTYLTRSKKMVEEMASSLAKNFMNALF